MLITKIHFSFTLKRKQPGSIQRNTIYWLHNEFVSESKEKSICTLDKLQYASNVCMRKGVFFPLNILYGNVFFSSLRQGVRGKQVLSTDKPFQSFCGRFALDVFHLRQKSAILECYWKEFFVVFWAAELWNVLQIGRSDVRWKPTIHNYVVIYAALILHLNHGMKLNF